MLKRHQLCPGFSLTDLSGQQVDLWNFRQKKNVVLLFVQNGPESFLRSVIPSIVNNYLALQRLDTEFLLILSGHLDACSARIEKMHLPFPVLLDIEFRAWPAYLESEAPRESGFGLFVLDRYGELWAQWHGSSRADFPALAELLEWLQWIEEQCPE
ncbi:MAG: peroxiredoxin family protein [bacterium]